jgi:septation ring formation regulator EzrA
MNALFVALGIAVITLLALLLWFVPHLLHQQAVRNAQEAADLRDMLLDMLSEQEAVTMRQSQLSTAIAYLQDQLEQAVSTARLDGERGHEPLIDAGALRLIEERIGAMQGQIQTWLDTRARVQRNALSQDNEAWANLMSLLAAIQDRVGTLSTERTSATVSVQARVLIEELEQEMEHLRSISEDIATLQWRLRRSLTERESNISTLRAKSGGSVG